MLEVRRPKRALGRSVAHTGLLLPRFELLSPRGAYNLLFTRSTRVFELYVGELVACGYPMRRYITPFYFRRKKGPGHVLFIASRARARCPLKVIHGLRVRVQCARSMARLSMPIDRVPLKVRGPLELDVEIEKSTQTKEQNKSPVG